MNNTNSDSWYMSGSNRMIQNQMQLSSDVKTIAERMDEIENGQQVLIKNQEYIIKTLNKVVNLLVDKKPSATKKPPAQKRQNVKCKTPSASDVSKLLHLPQALQKNISKFTENVIFNPTSIPDELIESECLSEDECSTIASKTSYKDQIRLLIRKIKTRGPDVIEKSLEIVGKDHPYLQQEVNKSLEVIVSENKNRPVCVICVMRSTVDLKDVGDDLWKAEIISDDVYEDIMECENIHKSRPILWDIIINSINNYEQPREALDILVSALESKYKYIVDYLRETPERPSLNCSCCKKRRVRTRPAWSDFGSQTDLSTTSEVPKRKLPKTIYMQEELFSDESQSITSSQDVYGGSFKGVSFDALERFDSIGSGSDRVFTSLSFDAQNPTVSSTSSDVINNNKTDRNRHSSGYFDPQETLHSTEEHNRSLPIICIPDSVDERDSENEERPELKRGISNHSNATVVPSRSTVSSGATPSTSSSHGDNHTQRLSQSTDGLVSPDIKVQRDHVEFRQDNGNKLNREITKESDDDEPLYVRQKAYRRRRLKSMGAAEVEYQVEEQTSSYIDQARQRRNKRKRFARQKSLQHGDVTVITTPRPSSDQTSANIGVRVQESRKSKQSMKRELRRQRSQGKMENDYEASKTVDIEEKGLKKPFNPLWGKDFLQPKLSPKWDYHQARRHWQMSQLHASSTQIEKAKSDTDLRAEELSDLMAYSDFTT